MRLAVDVRDFGAIGDGRTVCTGAINRAIEHAVTEGIGLVVVPPGTYVTGTVVLRSNLVLELRPGATLLASPDPAEYPDLPLRGDFPRHLLRGAASHHHFLYAEGCENLILRGGGTLDGNVAAFTPGWETKQPFTWTGAKDRPFVPMLEFLRCRDLRLEGITIQNSPGWTCHLCLCDRVWVQGVRLYNYVFAGNSDGFDVDGCHDVIFTGCHIETGDDCIVLKNFPDTRSTERITITGCVLRTLCAAVKIGTESWHDFRQIVFGSCVVSESSRAFQITCFDGATVEDITVHDLVVDTNTGNLMNRPVHIDLARRHTGFLPGVSAETAPPMGRVRRVNIHDLICRTDGRLILSAADGGVLEGVTLRNITMVYPWVEDPQALPAETDSLQCSASCPEARLARAAVVVRNASDFVLENLQVAWPEGPVPEDFKAKYSKGALYLDPRAQGQTPPFAAVWGRQLRRARIDVPGVTASVAGTKAVDVEGDDVQVR